jgi:hypothetical protein
VIKEPSRATMLQVQTISRRITVISEPHLTENKGRGRSCVDRIFTIQQLLKKQQSNNI